MSENQTRGRGRPFKYATDEEAIAARRQSALRSYHKHREENKDSRTETSRRYYDNNREKILARKREKYRDQQLAKEDQIIIEIVDDEPLFVEIID